MEDLKISEVTNCYENKPENLIQILREIHKEQNYITPKQLEELAQKLNIPLSKVYGATTFYTLLSPKPKGKFVLRICSSTPCHMVGSEDLLNYLKDKLEIQEGETTADGLFTLELTSCLGVCAVAPAIMVNDKVYGNLNIKKLDQIIDKCKRGELGTEKLTSLGVDILGNKESRVVLQNCGIINPESIEEYKLKGGYTALSKAIKEMTPQEVINEVKNSKLVGRGGAAFPTGLKWEFSFRTIKKPKYIICNADEGEPGTFKDRLVLENDPHKIVEAMVIAAYAVGAEYGYIYIRGEYGLSIKRINLAINKARENNFLGENILGTNFSFDIEVREGAGAYICGDETALMESIEGKRGEPRLKPPYPPTSGLWNKPTVINNVETLSNVPPIILKGADWYNKIGLAESTGTKILTLLGDVKNQGAVEVPLGTNLKDIIYDIGGGIKEGKKLKMVQLGGPSGSCLSPDMVDVSLDYKVLAQAGLNLGSGVVLVLNEDRCIVDTVRNMARFFRHESCGKCTPCREGTNMIYNLLTKIALGKGKDNDLETLKSLGETMKDASFCGLGQSAPNSLLDTLKLFTNEYAQHIQKKGCPLKICSY
ncbi:MAG: NADH-quinone oxidoreductase subunit NuoF [Candidatus Atribacteria bacterium]|nr:NADH-quinone oxidoreductase subunit NuoF [Candidatus Atribacteria bacterium]MCK4308976.1 NADH-quinone oxidoreductase subunit NuoF [Candidatus Atribacteria bacterium]